MRDWKRYEEAKRLRDTGLTLKATGAVLGVSGGRVREMLAVLERRERSRAWEADNPRPKPWWHGLAHRTKYELERAGFDSRESCAAFAADEAQNAAAIIDGKDARLIVHKAAPCEIETPCVARRPPKFQRFMAPAKPLPMLMPATSTFWPGTKCSAEITAPTGSRLSSETRNSRTTAFGSTLARAN